MVLGNELWFIGLSYTHWDVLRCCDIGKWVIEYWAAHEVMCYIRVSLIGDWILEGEYILIQCWVSVGWFDLATASRRKTDVDPLISVHEYFARI